MQPQKLQKLANHRAKGLKNQARRESNLDFSQRRAIVCPGS
jgi:hypothetical protein